MIKYGKYGIEPYDGGYIVGPISVRKNKETDEPEIYFTKQVYPSSGEAVIRWLQKQIRADRGARAFNEIRNINIQVAEDLKDLVDGEL